MTSCINEPRCYVLKAFFQDNPGLVAARDKIYRILRKWISFAIELDMISQDGRGYFVVVVKSQEPIPSLEIIDSMRDPPLEVLSRSSYMDTSE
jgi:hypothetical protein